MKDNFGWANRRALKRLEKIADKIEKLESSFPILKRVDSKYLVSSNIIESLSKTKTPQGLVAIVEFEKKLPKNPTNNFVVLENVPAGKVFVDGYGVGDVGNAVIRERKRLAEDGLMIISVVIEKDTGMIVSGPDIVSRGFVYVRDSEQLITEVKLVAQIVVDECIHDGTIEWGTIRNRIRDDISRLLYDRTKRSPMVLPLISAI